MKHSGRLILFAGIALFFFMLASLLMMSNALQNSDRFGELYSGLLLFNALGLLILIALIGLNLRGLTEQLKKRIPGTRMTVRMVTMFSILSVTPVLILYYFSLDFLHRGIDSWFDLRVEKALDDSLELSRLAIDIRMKELSKKTKQIADEFSGLNNAVVPFEIDDYRRRSGASELTLMTRQGAIIASSVGDATSLVPEQPTETILFQLQQGNNYIGLDTIQGGGLFIRVAVNVPSLQIDQPPQIIQALFPVPERINTLADSVQTAYVKYNELSYFRNQLKLSFILILTLVFLFSMFSAVWAAFYTARRLVAPIRDLAEGTRSVADGDYSTQLPVPANDELGFLVASFNEMTRRIAKSRNAVRQSQHEAEAQRAYLEAILGRLSSGVLVLDNAMQLRTANISSGYILGLEISSGIGKSLDDLEAEYNYLEPFFKTIKTQLRKKTNDWREQLTLFGTSGRQILMCSGTSLSINEDEDIVHVIVFDDITVLIQGQRDAAWSEMARRLAHEIKNPLTPIQLAAERLQLKYLGSLPPDQADTLNRLTNTIIQQVETMKDMVNTFSEYARAPAITLEPVDLNKLIQEAVDLYSNLDVNAKIHMQLNSELPRIMADPGRLRQVLNNLLNNAFDASSHESQTILNISTNHIFETGMEYIEVRVRDSGQGLSQDIIAGIFEPYVTTKKKGTGLGLAIVKKIVEEHSGVVMLENNSDGRGACAIIRLPVSSEISSRVQTNLAKGVI